MSFVKQLLITCTFIYFTTANQYSQYTVYYPPYSPQQYKNTSSDTQIHSKVTLYKLCSWNVIEFERPSFTNDSWNVCKLDAGRNYIPENNIPSGIGFDKNGRVFISLKRARLGVYATLAYFSLRDVKNGQCPPLNVFPNDQDNSLDTSCCSEHNLVNIERFNIDRCNRLWAVDRQVLGLNDKDWNVRSPRLMIYDLNKDQILREVPIPAENYNRCNLYQLGLETVIINVDPNDCETAYAYIIDTYHGSIIVYSYKQNKFWTVWSPEFYSDAKYSKFTIKTRKNKEVTYFKNKAIYDCTRDLKRHEIICHSCSSLDEIVVPMYEIENEALARCAPKSLNVKFLGQKCKNCQTGTHAINRENQVVWGAQELNYGLACWNRANPLNPQAVKVVVSDRKKLPHVCDMAITKQDLSQFGRPTHDRRYSYSQPRYDETYIVALSDNIVGIEQHGFDHNEENFGIYFIKESEALIAYPECLPKQHYQKIVNYYPSYNQPPPSFVHYQPMPQKSYQPAYNPFYNFVTPSQPYQPVPNYYSAPEPKPVAHHRYKKSSKPVISNNTESKN